MRALTHEVTDGLADCELTFVSRIPIDLGRARAQHAAYCALLRELGVDVRTIRESPEHPDAVFVEDTAVVLDEIAVLASLGAPSRRREAERMAPILAALRPLARLELPALLEGGDVLRVGRTLYVGLSTRTNAAGVAALAALVVPHGYRVETVEVQGCLHLKTAITEVAPGLLVANAAHVDLTRFEGCEILAVPPSEPGGANALRIAERVCLPASQPRTAELLARRGLAVRVVDIDELEKAEAGLTCMSLLFA